MVEFIDPDEQRYRREAATPPKSGGAITRFIIKYSFGLIKTPDQASYVILVLAILAIVVALYVFSNLNKDDRSKLIKGHQVFLPHLLSA